MELDDNFCSLENPQKTLVGSGLPISEWSIPLRALKNIQLPL